jgi:hypothetical protein
MDLLQWICDVAPPNGIKVSLEVEDFFHHREPFAGLLVEHRLEQLAHEFLPALVYGIAIQLIPGLIEVVDAQREKQILTAEEDRIIGYTDVFQFLKEFGPDALVFALIVLGCFLPNPQFEGVTRH